MTLAGLRSHNSLDLSSIILSHYSMPSYNFWCPDMRFLSRFNLMAKRPVGVGCKVSLCNALRYTLVDWLGGLPNTAYLFTRLWRDRLSYIRDLVNTVDPLFWD